MCARCTTLFEGHLFKPVPNYCPYCGTRMFGVVRGYLTDQGKIAVLRKDFKNIKEGRLRWES